MNSLPFHESFRRGTPDFPIELYVIDKLHPRYHMQLHWHKEHEIIRITEGSLKIQLNNKSYVLKKGNSVFIPSGTIHGAIPRACKYQCIVFATSVLCAVPKCKYIMETRLLSPIILENDKTVDNIFGIMESRETLYQPKVIGNLYLLIGNISDKKARDDVKPDVKIEKIKSAISYIQRNYYNNISLSELAATCSMSPNYFCRFFKKITQETPINYITIYRIEMACEKLMSGLSITDTAYSCGFNDTSYFIHVFKKNMNISPKQYQTEKLKAITQDYGI